MQEHLLYYRNMLIIVLSVALISPLKAQLFYTQSLSPEVKSLQVIADKDFLKLPVIGLDGNSSLDIRFDCITDDQPWIDYTIVHCNAQWERDNLDESDYLEYSYLPQHIEDVNPSFNTLLSYYHYHLSIPNEHIKPTISGNYAVLFHLQGEPDSLLAIATFMVSEGTAYVEGQVSGNTDIDFNALHQQLTLNVSWNSNLFPHLDPGTELSLKVQQNRRRDNEVWINHPSRIMANSAYYEHNRNLIFEAGNHWRRFEYTTHRYPSIGVDRIRYLAPIYSAFLYEDKQRNTDNYYFDQDQHGRYLIHALNVDDENTEAEYFRAMFVLKAPLSLNARGIYLVGDFTYQQQDSLYRMEYDYTAEQYHKEVLLKSGAYNYQYLVPAGFSNIANGVSRLTTSVIEGNHYETPNEYQVYVYLKTIGSRYDRLIGATILK